MEEYTKEGLVKLVDSPAMAEMLKAEGWKALSGKKSKKTADKEDE